MSLAGTAWPGAPAQSFRAAPSDAVTTKHAALKARSVFVRRAMRRVVQLSIPQNRASILILGGRGRDALELVEQCGGFVDLDVDIVSLDCDASLLSEAAALPLESPGRLTIVQKPPLLEWTDGSTASTRTRDLVVLDSLLDDLDDTRARRLFQNSFDRLRPGGVVWGARFAEPFGTTGRFDPSGWADAILRRGGSLRVLDRGPNLWVGVSRTVAITSVDE